MRSLLHGDFTIRTLESGQVEIDLGHTRFVIQNRFEGRHFMTAHNADWASVPVGGFQTLGAAIDRALQPFTFPPLASREA